MKSPLNRRTALLTTLGLTTIGLSQVGRTIWSAPRSAEDLVRDQDQPSPRASDRLPDVTLTNHRGEQVRFYSDLIADRPVVINLMYANCSGTCPGTTAKLGAIWADLEQKLGADLRLISVTLDPLHDTPAVLAKYAQPYQPRPEDNLRSDWQFLTGRPSDIEKVRQGLGLTDPDPQVDRDRSQHAALLTFGNDRTNRWSTVPVEVPEKRMIQVIARNLRPLKLTST